MRVSAALVATLILLSTAYGTAAEPAENFFFKKGDRIVFLGDSITEQYQYSTYIELYLTTRFPKWDLTFLNAGISGDTAAGGAKRFAEHVLAEKPTAVTIDFGMNDGGYGGFNRGASNSYAKNTATMLEMAKKAGVRVALISPNAVDCRPRPNLTLYLETQKHFYAPLKDLGTRYEMPFVDQYAVTRAALEKMQAEDPQHKKIKPFPDGVHTSPEGGLLMAHTILTGLHAPTLVSDLQIDAAAGMANPKACQIDKLQSSTSAVQFDRTDDALPLPLLKNWLPILPYVNDLKDLNWYGLNVTGLASGKYLLLIDGKEMATYTADQLAQGVNLASLTSGPILDQGQKVLSAINAKNAIVHQRFRGVVMFQAPDWLADVVAERKPRELAKRMEQINSRQAAICKMVQPQTHHFELKQAN
jgi:lysophospholipase L1-like esterase